MILELLNPHAVLAALERRPQDVLDVTLGSERPTKAWAQVAELARERGVRVHRADSGVSRGGGRDEKGRAKDGARRGRGGASGGKSRKGGTPDGGRRGATLARVKPLGPLPVEQLFRRHKTDGHDLWLALDQVQDPHNLGAVFRSASFFGVAGILLTRDRSAPLTAVAYDVSCGGLEHVPYASPPNLDRALKEARDAGLWILGAAGEAQKDVAEIPRDRSWVLVLGNEESGLRRLTREACDDLCRLSPRGAVDALNVSSAGAVLMSHLTQPEATTP